MSDRYNNAHNRSHSRNGLKLAENMAVQITRIYPSDLTDHERSRLLEQEFEVYSQLTPPLQPLTMDRDPLEGKLHISFPAGELLEEFDIAALTFADKLQLFEILASCLAELHAQNFVALSLTPASFLIEHAKKQAVLINYSSAARFGPENSGINSFRPLQGDAHYLAPEQSYQFKHYLDQRTDLYALGCIFYWLLTGEPPFSEQQSDDDIAYAHIAKSLDFSDCVVSKTEPKLQALIQIIDKLLMKDPDERYQSASGLLWDLKTVSQSSEAKLSGFKVASHDLSDRLVIPQKLYGREKEVGILLDTFQRVSSGPSEAVLVAGYSGVGKSALVYEVQKPILHSNGLFVFGKFDQYQNSSPYSAIGQAFGHFVRNILALPVEEMTLWKRRLEDALYPNAQVIIDLIPELGVLLPDQPALSPLGADEQQNRFNRVFLNFIHAICIQHKPLVVFIDDLQWADLASINLLRLILSDSDSQHCLVLGAYRDNEVDERHPFIKMLADLEQDAQRITHIELQPLGQPDLQNIISDALQLPRPKIEALSELVYEKTAGNPFFFRQFLHELYQSGSLTFSVTKRCWQWSMAEIRKQSITDNVVELMIQKISRLPKETQLILQQAACVGSRFDKHLIQMLYQGDKPLESLLQPALDMGLLLPVRIQGKAGPEYSQLRFLHDRVQQAAYSFLNAQQKEQLHHNIGAILLSETALGDWEENCFILALHLNKAIPRLSLDQRSDLIELNWLSARRAITATAYETALGHLDHMFNLLDQSALEDTDKLNTAKLAKLECLYLAGKFAEAENFLSEIKQQKFNEQQSLELNIVLITQYTRYGHLDLAIRQGLSGLAGLGYELPEAPDMEAVGEAIGMIQVELENCPFAELLDKPQLTDATISRVMEILIAMQPCCYNSGSLLFPLTILHLLKLTMQHGNTQHSSYVFMMYALMCTKVLKDYSTAFEADRCSRLVGERFPAPALVDGRLRMMRANFVQPWQQPLINSSSLRDDAYHACLEQGDYYWGVHAYLFGFYADLFASNSISPLLERTQQVISTCTKIKQPAQVFLSQLQSNLLSILSGKLDNLVNLDHEPGYEAKALQHYQDTGYMCGKYDRLLGRLLQGYLFGSYRTALEITLDESLTNADLDEGIFHEAAYVFLNMLCILAIQHESASDIPSRWLDWYAQAKERLLLWNSINPDTFSPMHYLVEAEEARLAAQRVEAMCSYEKAIHSAQGSSLLLEALANERMGCFRISLQQESLGRAYIEEAIRLYSDWGATAKAGELEQYLGNLQSPQSLPRGTEFDWHAVLAASQEISQEVNLDNLLRVALERVARVSGAEKVSYFSCSDGAWRLEGLLDKDHFSEPSEQPGLLPESVLNYCNNSKEILSLKDALFDGDFILDPYIQHFRIRSLLALPLIYRDQIVAVILCEHSETSNLFSANRQQILTVLASQLVISLSNAEMYQSLENQNQDLEQMVVQRTASLNKRTKHLEAILESLPIPYVVSSLKGRVISANKLWYQLFMLDGEAAKKVNTAEFYINPDDRDRMVLSLMHKGHVTDFDCELKNHHGEPFWALFSATLIEVQGEQAVFAAMSDISARKALEGMLHKQAHTDPLTGILNRRAVLDLSSQYKKAAEDESVFVAMLDLDYFKRLNDTYSHSAGDQVLKAFASEVSGLLRDGDVFARMGGEEFLVMLSVGSEEQAELILQRIREKIAMMTVPFDSVDLKVTVSIGFAAWSSDAEFKQVTHQADLALYEAKGRGRNMVVCLD